MTMTDTATQEPEQPIFEEALLSQEELLELPHEEKTRKIQEYRTFVTDGGLLSDNSYSNAARLIRALRAKAITSKGTKAVKKVEKLDLLNF